MDHQDDKIDIIAAGGAVGSEEDRHAAKKKIMKRVIAVLGGLLLIAIVILVCLCVRIFGKKGSGANREPAFGTGIESGTQASASDTGKEESLTDGTGESTTGDIDNGGAQDGLANQGTGESAEPVTAVNMVCRTDETYDYLVISGYAEDGNMVWQNTTEKYPVGELGNYHEIGIAGDHFLYVEAGTVKALDLETGEEVWSNGEFGGFGAASVIGAGGEVWLCGGDGPDLYCVDAFGNTVLRRDKLQEDAVRPFEITINGVLVSVRYEYIGNSPDESRGELLLYNTLTGETTDGEKLLIEYPEELTQIVYPISATATTTLASQGQITYGAMNLFDADLGTVYCEGAAGTGEKTALTFTFAEPVQIRAVRWYPGYQESEELLAQNGYPTRISMYFSDAVDAVTELTQTPYVGYGELYFLETVEDTTVLTIIFDAAKAGEEYENTCLAELQFFAE